MTSYLPIILAIFSYLVYHVSQKSLGNFGNPLWITGLAYTIAAAVSWILLLIVPHEPLNFKFSWAIVLIGLSVVGLDIGFIYAYRMGWNVGTAPLFTNAAVAILLLPIGILFFREKPTVISILGFILCIIGMCLLKNK